jgi:hypothetical protein
MTWVRGVGAAATAVTSRPVARGTATMRPAGAVVNQSQRRNGSTAALGGMRQPSGGHLPRATCWSIAAPWPSSRSEALDNHPAIGRSKCRLLAIHASRIVSPRLAASARPGERPFRNHHRAPCGIAPRVRPRVCLVRLVGIPINPAPWRWPGQLDQHRLQLPGVGRRIRPAQLQRSIVRLDQLVVPVRHLPDAQPKCIVQRPIIARLPCSDRLGRDPPRCRRPGDPAAFRRHPRRRYRVAGPADPAAARDRG